MHDNFIEYLDCAIFILLDAGRAVYVLKQNSNSSASDILFLGGIEHKNEFLSLNVAPRDKEGNNILLRYSDYCEGPETPMYVCT